MTTTTRHRNARSAPAEAHRRRSTPVLAVLLALVVAVVGLGAESLLVGVAAGVVIALLAALLAAAQGRR